MAKREKKGVVEKTDSKSSGNLDRQYEEAEALCDVFGPEGGFLWLNRPDTEEDGEMAYSVTVKSLSPSTPLTAVFIITNPVGYPGNTKDLPEILAVEGSDAVAKRLGELSKKALVTVESELKEGYEFPLLAALEGVRQLLTEIGSGEEKEEKAVGGLKETTIDDTSVEDILKSEPTVLGRRMLGIVHIRNKEHMKYCKKLANEWNLGGMGNPNAIVIEGDERLCIKYTDIMIHYIKKVTVRGEEQIPVPKGEKMDDLRALPKHFEFVKIDEMEKIAKLCRDHGLEELFLTYLKVYGGRQSSKK
ncbi:hypothetical protein Pmar_PMAR021809 [Perkinsus marinus ATCC 50983]|uniref:RWD domain-containing protein n=1 Tax=Perkinsus marinus (strain ATCC 50983 / TXsc) TaxID=423536 RepID=C5LG49_PERM5|nr:hypothetical protein Pmar_PMAR021809 [Perkinsus marinus ATCC 50983]EER04304.1 hypothetical protein Pmar_PMAR021809 [Perkinsus marinus ATCC 50983]|eukprot:XP_002772488.1 hypothetical protein Pmar_PMAR021809 [Perkinsus marinus ATCC 50983]